jgi:hypothetical protein
MFSPPSPRIEWKTKIKKLAVNEKKEEFAESRIKIYIFEIVKAVER